MKRREFLTLNGAVASWRPYTDRAAAELKASFASHGFTFSNALWFYQAFANQFDKTVADSLIPGLRTIVCSPRPRLQFK